MKDELRSCYRVEVGSLIEAGLHGDVFQRAKEQLAEKYRQILETRFAEIRGAAATPASLQGKLYPVAETKTTKGLELMDTWETQKPSKMKESPGTEKEDEDADDSTEWRTKGGSGVKKASPKETLKISLHKQAGTRLVTMEPASHLSGSTKEVAKVAKVGVSECICDRPPAPIVCNKCGAEWTGRIKFPCPAHPNKIQLMDWANCYQKSCQSTFIKHL